jgi:hypothetical protein
MAKFTRAMYGLLGTLAIAAGIVALVVPSLAVDDAASSPLVAHLVREQAAGFVFIGLMFFWCLRHFEHRGVVHAGLLLFTVLFAGIHWAGYLGSNGYIRAALVNTLPVVVLAVTSPFFSRR